MNPALATTYVVIPAYNEGQVIADVISTVLKHCPNVVVVDDGSADDTGLIARARGATVLRHVINLGQGAALQTGLQWALRLGASHVVTFDADGQHDAGEIERLVDALSSRDADVALGSRFLGAAVGLTPMRRAVLQLARWVNFVFTGLYLSDAHNGFRAFSRHGASKIRMRQAGMAHATEILAQIADAKLDFIEVPVTIRYTEYSVAKGQKLSNSLNILIDLFLKGLVR